MKKQEIENQFSNLYEKYFNEIYQYVFLRTGFNEVAAEDITQDIFVDVFKGLDQFKGLCSERTWIYRIGKNKVADYYRDYYRKNIEVFGVSQDTLNLISDPACNVEKYMENLYEGECIKQCFDSIPEHYKMILILKYIDNKSVRQIAGLVGKSVKATESCLQRAKAAFIKQYVKMQESEEQP